MRGKWCECMHAFGVYKKKKKTNKQTKIRKEKQTHVRGVVGMHAFGVYTHFGVYTEKGKTCVWRVHSGGNACVWRVHKKGGNIRLACTHKKSGKHVFGVYAKKKRKK